MDLQSYRDFVRAQLDLEVEDLGDILIDRWVSQAVTKIANHVQTWPFYETSTTIEVDPEVSDYTTDLKEVRSVYVPTVGVLDAIDENTAENHYYRSSGVRVGKPVHFSLWGVGNIRLWPIPDANYTATVRGYRRPTTRLVESGATPDLPEDFHEVVLQWVLHMAYMHEDDPELAAVYKLAYDEMLAALTATEMALDPTHPIVLNGGARGARGSNPFGPPQGPGLGGWGGS